MNIIELHILQSFPVSCLNRDDLGSPKSAIFGGTKRARISSQCLKRAQRDIFKVIAKNYSKGSRTRLIKKKFREIIEGKKVDGINVDELSNILLGVFKDKGKETDKDKGEEYNVLLYFSEGELEMVVDAALNVIQEKQGVALSSIKADILKKAKEVIKGAVPHDAADVALYGRMVADNASLNVEGAAMFSHALSTHRVENELDFYTAVDDNLSGEETGAGMMGMLEFSSACYYRYVCLDVGLLEKNISNLDKDKETRDKIISAFIKSALLAVPKARKNSMNAYTLPSYVMGLVRKEGHPIQLINAFETPVKSKDGYVSSSREALIKHLTDMKGVWGIKAEEVCIPDVNVDQFVEKILDSLQ